MQAKGQPLVSTLLLLLPLLSALAHKSDNHVFSKRSVDDITDGDPSWQAPTSSNDDITAAKRFTEFVGKRARSLLTPGRRFERAGKLRPYEVVFKRFVTKRNAEDSPKLETSQHNFPRASPLSFSPHKPAVVEVFGKRMQLPYEFVGKRIMGSAWERVWANAIEGDILVKGVTDILNKEDADSDHQTDLASRRKRYAEWLGKRGGPIADQLLRDLVNKRISAMMLNRLQNSANPEFIGRRENDEDEEDLKVRKRYTEFIGK